jgi:flagellar basal body-associated protein FliL
MIKDLPPEPLEFTFEDDSTDSDESSGQTYTLPVKSAESLDLSAELSLGEPIESAPIITPGENLFSFEEEEDDLVITGAPVKATIQPQETQNLATETAQIISQLEDAAPKDISSLIEEDQDLPDEEEELDAEASAVITQAIPETAQEPVPIKQPQAALQTAAQKKKKKKDSSSLLVNLIVGSVILSVVGIVVVVNLFLFGNASNQHESELTKVISNSPGNVAPAPSNREAEKKAKEIAASFIKIGEISSNGLTGEYKFVYNLATNIGSFQLNGSLEKPKPLSIEEVGRKVAAPSWLKRIESQGSSIKNLTNNSRQSLSIPTRFYFETNGVSTRLIGTTEVTIVRDKADNITLDYALNIPSSTKIVMSEQQIEGRITFSF